MSKKNDFKDSIKQPDAFITTSEHILAWIERHATLMFTLVLVGTLGGVGYVGYNYFRHRAEAAAVNALYGPEAELKKAEAKIRDERAKKMQELAGLKNGAQAPSNPDDLRPVDYAKDYAPAVERLKAALKEQAGTRAAVVSALNLANFLVQQKQYAEALSVIQIPTFKPSTSDLLGGFWRMHQGLVLLENDKAKEALELYKEVVAAADLQPFHSEAMLKMGITYELLGDKTQAQSTYEKIGREFAKSEAASSAAQYLRLMEMKGQ